MSDLLHPQQFRSAYEEGKAASDWLATGPGHTWQTKKTKPRSESAWDVAARPSRYSSFHEGNARSFGMFQIKNDDESEGGWWDVGQGAYHHPEWANDYPQRLV